MGKEKLTGKLKVFWQGLNKGEIDWNLVMDKNPGEERESARQMLIQRGFLVLRGYQDGVNRQNETLWKVVYGANMNPDWYEQTWYFTSARHADSYQSYLSKNNKIPVLPPGDVNTGVRSEWW